MKTLKRKVAFVTGGASGVGLAMVRSFLRAAMKVVATDVEAAALARLRTEFAGNNAFLALQLDVTDRAAMAAAADATERAFGKVHVLCNNAGVAVFGRIDTQTYADWDWVLGVNLHGVVNGLQTFIERIKKHGEGGHIVNTASIAGQSPLPGLTVYNASKYAVVGISETIRQELAPLNIGVSVLCPGEVSTNIGTSQRNRPTALKRRRGDPRSLRGRRRLDPALRRAIDPALVGDMVVDALRNDDAYIFTHPELKSLVDARFAKLDEGFARWAAWQT